MAPEANLPTGVQFFLGGRRPPAELPKIAHIHEQRIASAIHRQGRGGSRRCTGALHNYLRPLHTGPGSPGSEGYSARRAFTHVGQGMDMVAIYWLSIYLDTDRLLREHGT